MMDRKLYNRAEFAAGVIVGIAVLLAWQSLLGVLTELIRALL